FILISSIIIGFFLFNWVLDTFPNSPIVRRFSEGTNEGDDQRLDFFKMAWDLFLDSPIFGYGMDTFRFFSSFVYTHSTYSEILFNGGIVYVLLFASFYFISFHKINNSALPIQDDQSSVIIKSFIISVLRSEERRVGKKDISMFYMSNTN